MMILLAVCLIFPPFWILAPFVLLAMLIRKPRQFSDDKVQS